MRDFQAGWQMISFELETSFSSFSIRKARQLTITPMNRFHLGINIMSNPQSRVTLNKEAIPNQHGCFYEYKSVILV